MLSENVSARISTISETNSDECQGDIEEHSSKSPVTLQVSNDVYVQRTKTMQSVESSKHSFKQSSTMSYGAYLHINNKLYQSQVLNFRRPVTPMVQRYENLRYAAKPMMNQTIWLLKKQQSEIEELRVQVANLTASLNNLADSKNAKRKPFLVPNESFHSRQSEARRTQLAKPVKPEIIIDDVPDCDFSEAYIQKDVESTKPPLYKPFNLQVQQIDATHQENPQQELPIDPKPAQPEVLVEMPKIQADLEDPFAAIANEVSAELSLPVVKKKKKAKTKKKEDVSPAKVPAKVEEETKDVPQQVDQAKSGQTDIIITNEYNIEKHNDKQEKRENKTIQQLLQPEVMTMKKGITEQGGICDEQGKAASSPKSSPKQLIEQDFLSKQLTRSGTLKDKPRNGTLRSKPNPKDIFNNLASQEKNKPLQFFLAVMETLQLPKNDAIYLESISEALSQKTKPLQIPTKMEKKHSWFSMRQEGFKQYREKSLRSTLQDDELNPDRENKLIIDALLQACQILAKQNSAITKEHTSLVTNLFKHNTELHKIKKVYLIEQMRMHFAFMFACPLVTRFGSKELKPVPQLKYNKEFGIIKDKMVESKHTIRFLKRQCTVDSLQEVISQRPLGMHFSGHGIRNTEKLGDQFYYENKNKGDFLLLETNDGDAQLVSRDQLKEIILKANCNLEFVVVLTCHSQFVGEIFLQAGTKHVVCIDQDHEVEDDAAMTFTETFYRSVFQQNMSVCRAFDFAKQSVGIRHGEQQESIFLLLVHDKTKVNCINENYSRMPRLKISNSKSLKNSSQNQCEKHVCTPLFGKIMQGACIDLGINQVELRTTINAKPSLIGRYKEMYQVVQKLLSPTSGKIYTIWGQHGIGKTVLVQAVMHYINERNLVKGGCFYISVRQLASCEVFLLNFNLKVVKDNAHIFGPTNEFFERQSKDQTNLFHLILRQISQLDQAVVFVIDSCEQLINRDKVLFKQVLNLIITIVPKASIILTSTLRIKEGNEQLIVVDGLDKMNAYKLFCEHANRPIDQKEQNALLEIIPDPIRFPEQQFERARIVQDHHLFKLIGGNPQSILMIAPLLKDPHHALTLAELYKHLTTNQNITEWGEEEVLDSYNSMQLTIEAAFKNIASQDQEALELFFIVSLFPGGIQLADIDEIWSQFKSFQSQDLALKETWKRAWLKLKQAKMLEVHNMDNVFDDLQVQDNEEDMLDEKTVIIIPTFLQRYAQCLDQKFDEMISNLEERVAEFHLKSQLATYRSLEWKFGSQPTIMVNKNSQNKDKATLKQSQGMNQANIDALFSRMADKYGTSNLEVAVDDENDQTQPIFEITHEDSSDEISSPYNTHSEGVSPQRESKLKEGTDFFIQMLELPNNKVSKRGDSFVMKQRESETKARVNSIVQKKISSLLSQVKNNNEFSKAKQRWLWACQKIKTQLRTKSLLCLNTISFAVGQESDQNDSELQVKNESAANEEVDTLKIEKQIKMNVKAFFNLRASCVKRKVTNLGKKVTLKALAQLEDENVNQMHLKQLRRLNVGSRMSLGMLSKEPPQLMQVDEYVALVHCMNLIINNMHQMALVCIETKLSKLNTCSVLFTANLKRIQAFCCMTNFLEALNKLNETQITSKMQRMNMVKSITRQSMSVLSDQSNELVADFKEISQMLQKSLKSFKEIKCMWGMGLVKFQKAFLLKTLVERYLLGDVEQVNLQVSLVLAAAIGNLEVAQEKCKHEFECAFQKFKAISHLRGMALCALSIVSNKSHSKFSNDHKDQEHQSSFESEEISSDEDEMADKQNHHGYVHDSHYSQAYKTAIQQFYKEQRTVERDCCITRKQGEDFSLLTEICKSAQAKPLFEVGLSRQIHVSDGDKATEHRRRNKN